MQTAAYNPVRARNIAREMAEAARERGESLTKGEFLRLGFTEEQITRHAHDASVLYAQSLNRAA
ncbi:hypothetical protein [Rhizobium sp. WW_1]|jgi:hypothetical protein|uniref:hypothetical protein n=1 Tax=Rhizobium sp. WW_1 TaxID=1907375 RepID=UPI0006485E43|nr:hypothetical protein [Rhizobium sp. WW_1]RKD61685.1 hypothetical protein BJ928_107287 [Rhizobium sp. WW_1]